MLGKVSGFIPLAMSSIAFALVVAHAATAGVAPQADEGAAAHLWQLLMIGQLPFIAYFSIRWVASAPRRGLIVLATQLAAALRRSARAPAPVLGWLHRIFTMPAQTPPRSR